MTKIGTHKGSENGRGARVTLGTHSTNIHLLIQLKHLKWPNNVHSDNAARPQQLENNKNQCGLPAVLLF
jgi:hypothetical protein